MTNKMITDKWVFICSPPRSASTFCTWLLQGEGVFVTDEQNWLLSMYDIFQFWVQKRNEGFEPNDARIMFGDKKYHFGLLNNACLKSPEAGAYSIALGLRQLHGNPEWFGDKYPWYAIIRNWQKLWKILLDGAYYLGRSAEIRFIVCLRDYSDTKQSFKLLLENQNESIEDYEMHLKRAYHGAHELLNIHQKETLFIDFKEFKEDWQKTGNKMRQWLQLDTIQYPEPPSWAYSVNSKKKIPITYNELSNNTKQAPYTKSNLKSNSMKPLSSNGMGKPDIVLTICPPWDVITPPLGLGYIMAYLKSQDINAKLIDLNILLYHEIDNNSRNLLWKFDSFKEWEQQGYKIIGEDFDKYINFCVDQLLQFDSNIFGFSLYHANVGLSVEIARRVKKARNDSIIVFGGPSCSDPFDRSDIPDNIPDFVIQGEGEKSLVDLILYLKNKKAPYQLPEILKANNEGITTKCILPDLNQIPFPSYLEFPLDKYTGQGIIRIIGSRGCVAKCNFCNESFYTGKYRYRDANLVLKEMMYHTNRYGVKYFIFSDQEINGNIKQLENLCDLLIEKDMGIQWTAQAIPMKKMSKALLLKMKKAGCTSLDFGLESGSSTLLKRMGKPFSRTDAESAISNCHNAGILAGVNIIVGFPGESKEELFETMDFLKQNREQINKVSNISTCFIKPFSDLFFNPQNYGIKIPQKDYFWYNWEDISNNGNRNNKDRIKKLHKVVDYCRKHKIYIENVYSFS